MSDKNIFLHVHQRDLINISKLLFMNILIDEPYTYDEITFNGWSSIYLLWSVRHTDNILIINAREFKKMF